jgi:hypothetical protein
VRQLEEQIATLKAGGIAPADGTTAPAPAPAPGIPTDRAGIEKMAADIAAANEFNAQVGREVQRGQQEHADFNTVAGNLQRFGELPRTFVEAALATGKGADIIYHLGGNLAEADRVLSLPPMAQAVAIAEISQKIATKALPKVISDAPAPITPRVGGTGRPTPSLEDEKTSMSDWMKLREKQVADARRARR